MPLRPGRGAAVTLVVLTLGGVTLAQAPTATVTVQAFQFTPSSLTVKAGTTVTWVNRDDIQHTVTAGTPERTTGTFDLRLSGGGASGSATFAAPGVHPYYCARHRAMRGEIRVD